MDGVRPLYQPMRKAFYRHIRMDLEDIYMPGIGASIGKSRIQTAANGHARILRMIRRTDGNDQIRIDFFGFIEPLLIAGFSGYIINPVKKIDGRRTVEL